MKKPDGEWKEKNGSWYLKQLFVRWVKYINVTCIICKEEFLTRHPESQTCSAKCRAIFRWRSTPIENRWRVVSRSRSGYTFIHVPGHQHLFPEHRYIMEKFMGRKLNSNEHIHHINGNRADNRIENLILLKRRDHNSHHKKNEVINRTRDDNGRFI